MSHDERPRSVKAEEALLGSILINADVLHHARSRVKDGRAFYQKKNGWIYDAMLYLADEGWAVDFLTVCEELERRDQLTKAGGPAFVTRLVNVVPSSIHWEDYAREVESTYFQRRGIAAGGEIAGYAFKHNNPHDILAYANGVLSDLEVHTNGDGLVAARDVVSAFYDDLQAWQKDPLPPGAVRGISTGIRAWDRMMGGLERGESCVVIAARPRVGKTALTITSAYRMAKIGYRVAFFALEMKRRTLIARLAMAESKVAYKNIKRGVKDGSNWYASADEYSRFVQRAIELGDVKHLYIDETQGLTLPEIRARAVGLARKIGGLDLIVVDTGNLIQCDTGRGENFAQSESRKVRGFRNLIKELDCVGYITWQLNKGVDSRPVANFGRRPQLGDLRDTGGVEEHASDVIGLYRDQLYNEQTEHMNIMELIGLKRRNDEDSTVSHVYYNPVYQTFEEVELRKQEL